MAEKDPKKKKSIGSALDKIFMGAIIGGAIGSVLGMSVAPKKGKETRQFLKRKTLDIIEKAEKMLRKNEPNVEEEIKNLATKARQRGDKIFNFLSHEEQKQAEEEDIKKIPHEEK